jgi:hypothetical protein
MSKSKNINPEHHLCWDRQCFRNRPLTCLGMNGNWVWELVDLAWGKQILPEDSQNEGWIISCSLCVVSTSPAFCVAGACRNWAQNTTNSTSLQHWEQSFSVPTPCSCPVGWTTWALHASFSA